MKVVDFSINKKQLDELLRNSKDGKNSDIGKMAIEIVKLYFKRKDSKVIFQIGKRNQPDITVICMKKSVGYEVKGTQDSEIAYSKLKISSKFCHDELKNGMEIIRVTNIRNKKMKLYFLRYGEDFTLIEEPRWAIKKIN